MTDGTRPDAGTIRHLDYLDGWRGVAILLVLGDHFFHFAGGRLGVEVFFALSGLLMSRILFETDISIRTFYRRRIARIVPVFLLYLAAVALMAAPGPSALTWRPFIYNLLMVQAYAPAGTFSPELPLGHLWSLNVEEHGYVLLSVIAATTRRRWAVCAALAALAGFCVVMYGVEADLGVAGTRRTECAAFCLLASASLHLALRDAPHPGRLLAFGTGVLVASFLASRAVGSSIYLDYIGKPLGLAIMVNSLRAAPEWVHRVLSVRTLRWFGVTSFSLYLWQQPFYGWVVFGRMAPLAGLAGAIAVGAASFYLFETPMRNLIRNWRPGRSTEWAPR